MPYRLLLHLRDTIFNGDCFTVESTEWVQAWTTLKWSCPEDTHTLTHTTLTKLTTLTTLTTLTHTLTHTQPHHPPPSSPSYVICAMLVQCSEMFHLDLSISIYCCRTVTCLSCVWPGNRTNSPLVKTPNPPPPPIKTPRSIDDDH